MLTPDHLTFLEHLALGTTLRGRYIVAGGPTLPQTHFHPVRLTTLQVTRIIYRAGHSASLPTTDYAQAHRDIKRVISKYVSKATLEDRLTQALTLILDEAAWSLRAGTTPAEVEARWRARVAVYQTKQDLLDGLHQLDPKRAHLWSLLLIERRSGTTTNNKKQFKTVDHLVQVRLGFTALKAVVHKPLLELAAREPECRAKLQQLADYLVEKRGAKYCTPAAQKALKIVAHLLMAGPESDWDARAEDLLSPFRWVEVRSTVTCQDPYSKDFGQPITVRQYARPGPGEIGKLLTEF